MDTIAAVVEEVNEEVNSEEYNAGTVVHAYDDQTGNWYAATVLAKRENDQFQIRYSGFPRKVSDVIIHLKNLRVPVLERLLPRNSKFGWLEASRLLRDDTIQYIRHDGETITSVVVDNDPFMAYMKTAKDARVPYEALVPALAAETEVSHVHQQNEPKKKVQKVKQAKSVTKKKEKAKTLASGEAAPPPTVDSINKAIGNNKSPLKYPLTDNELLKVRDKVQTWKEKSDSASTAAEFKKIDRKLDSVFDKLIQMNENVNKTYVFLNEVVNKNALQATFNSASITDISGNTSFSSDTDANDSDIRQWLFGGDLPSSSQSPISVAMAALSQSEAQSPCYSHDFSTPASQSFGAPATAVKFTQNSSTVSSAASSMVQARSSLPPMVCSSPSNLLELPQGETGAQLTEYVDCRKVEEIYRCSRSSRTAFVAKLTIIVFEVREIQGRNSNGKQNKMKLDEAKEGYIKRQTFAWFPCPAANAEAIWKAEGIKTIDRVNRSRLRMLNLDE